MLDSETGPVNRYAAHQAGRIPGPSLVPQAVILKRVMLAARSRRIESMRRRDLHGLSNERGNIGVLLRPEFLRSAAVGLSRIEIPIRIDRELVNPPKGARE